MADLPLCIPPGRRLQKQKQKQKQGPQRGCGGKGEGDGRSRREVRHASWSSDARKGESSHAWQTDDVAENMGGLCARTKLAVLSVGLKYYVASRKERPRVPLPPTRSPFVAGVTTVQPAPHASFLCCGPPRACTAIAMLVPQRRFVCMETLAFLERSLRPGDKEIR